MPNHVHLILVPDAASGLTVCLRETHRRYTRHINLRERWRGYLWQGRFASCVLDEAHLLAAARDVERNPVCAPGCAPRRRTGPGRARAAISRSAPTA